MKKYKLNISVVVSLLFLFFGLGQVKAQTNIWQKELPDTLRLSDISLPGTHDTMAYQTSGFLGGLGKSYILTQNKTLEEQLDLGVRYLDLRIAKDLKMHHGVADLGTSFDVDVLPVMVQFLYNHPSEFLVVRIKSENNPDAAKFDEQLAPFLTSYREFFYQPLASQIPFLSEIRGKIVVLDDTASQSFNRREVSLGSWGSQDFMRLQDNYNKPGYETKFFDVTRLLAQSQSFSDNFLYVNHVSATGGVFSKDTPKTYAQNLNPRVAKYISEHNIKRTGILIYDFIDEELVLQTIAPMLANYRQMERH